MTDLDVGIFWTIGYRYEEGKDLQKRGSMEDTKS